MDAGSVEKRREDAVATLRRAADTMGRDMVTEVAQASIQLLRAELDAVVAERARKFGAVGGMVADLGAKATATACHAAEAVIAERLG